MDITAAYNLFGKGYIRAVTREGSDQLPRCLRCRTMFQYGNQALTLGGVGYLCTLCVDALLPYVPIQKKDLVHVSQNLAWSAVVKRRFHMACMSTTHYKQLEAAAKWPPRL
jgi:hypothetical protein